MPSQIEKHKYGRKNKNKPCSENSGNFKKCKRNSVRSLAITRRISPLNVYLKKVQSFNLRAINDQKLSKNFLLPL